MSTSIFQILRSITYIVVCKFCADLIIRTTWSSWMKSFPQTDAVSHVITRRIFIDTTGRLVTQILFFCFLFGRLFGPDAILIVGTFRTAFVTDLARLLTFFIKRANITTHKNLLGQTLMANGYGRMATMHHS